MASTNLSSKRKASTSSIPESVSSYVMGALRDNFDHLKAHILHDCAFVASNQFAKKLLEELFRYLYLLADSSSDGVIRSSPSYFVDQAFHCLMLDPLLYWKVCDEILNLQGKDINEVGVRLLPHDALGGTGDDEEPRKARYTNTLVQYKATFGEDPPLDLWSDYSNDPVAVQAELEAHQAQRASVHRPHHQSVSPVAVAHLETKSSSVEVLLCVEDQSGEKTFYKMKRSTKLIKVMQAFADQKDLEVWNLRFHYDNVRVNGEDTPLSLHMEDGDLIEVILSHTGC